MYFNNMLDIYLWIDKVDEIYVYVYNINMIWWWSDYCSLEKSKNWKEK